MTDAPIDFSALDQSYSAAPAAVATSTPSTSSAAAAPIDFSALDQSYSAVPAPVSIESTADAINGASAPVQQVPAPTGMGAVVAANVAKGAANTFNTLVDDPFGNLIGKPLATIGLTGYNLIAPSLGYQKVSPQAMNDLLGDTQPQIGTRAVSSLANAMNAPDPSQVVPQTRAQELVGNAVQGGTSLATLGAGTGLVNQGVLGLAGASGSTVGDVTSQLVPDDYKPIVGLAGNVIGTAGAGGAASLAKNVGQDIVGAGKTLMEPASVAGRRQMAARRIYDAATDPVAAQEKLANAQVLVPDSLPTSFEATEDPGLGALQSGVKVGNSDLFNARAAQQNDARVNAIKAISPADSSPEALATVGQAFRDQLDQITGMGDALTQSARTTAENATDAMGQAVPIGADQQTSALQALGKSIREPIAPNMAIDKDYQRATWDAIDPNHDLTTDAEPITNGASTILSNIPKTAKPMEGEPAAIFQAALKMPPTQPFQDLAAFRGRITDAMRDELSEHGSTPTYRNLTQLLGNVHDAMASGFTDKVASDAQAVASGKMLPSETTLAQLNQNASNWGNAGDASGNDAIRSDQQNPSARVGGFSGVAGNEGTPGGGRGATPSNPGMAVVPSTRVSAPPSLFTFLIRNGGLRDSGGELRSMDLQKQNPALYRVNGGLTFDYARELAEEAGYLPPGSDINDLLNAVSEEAQGRKVYPASQMQPEDTTAENSRVLEAARNKVLQAEEDYGTRLSSDEIDHATELTAMGMHPMEALINAVRAGDERVSQTITARQAMNGEGLPAGATQGDLGLSRVQPKAPITFDQAAAERYGAAREATRLYNENYVDAPGVGEIMAPGKTQGTYDIPDSQVASKILNGNAGVADRIQAYLKVGGSKKALEDYAAFDLRRAAETDNGWNAAKAQAWTKSHSELLSQLPEFAAKLRTASGAWRAVQDANESRNASIQAYQKSAAGKFLDPDVDPIDAMSKILRSDTAAAQLRDLAQKTKGNSAAQDGMRALIVRSIIKDFQGNTELIGGKEDMLANDKFQKFIKTKLDAMSPFLDAEQRVSLKNVFEDLRRSQLSARALRLPGSNTAQDTAGAAKHSAAGHATPVGTLIWAEILGDRLHHVAGPIGKIAGMMIAPMFARMRQNGLRKVDDLITQAVLNPAEMRSLLAKLKTPDRVAPVMQRVGQQMRIATMGAAAQAYNRDKRQTNIRSQPAAPTVPRPLPDYLKPRSDQPAQIAAPTYSRPLFDAVPVGR